MKHYLLLPLLLAFVTIHAQEPDSVRMRITYEAAYTYVIGDKSNGNDIMHLDIGERSSHFYSKLFARQEAVRDSFNRRGSVSTTMYDKATKGLEAGQTYAIFKNFPETGRLTCTDKIILDYFKYEEDMPQIEWNLLDKDTLIAGYRCQKAEGELRGRKWNVWFTTDIPSDNGPWKLGGLPGLILWADDAEGVFSFHCIGVEKAEGKAIAVDKRKYITCTPEKMNGIYADFRKNHLKYMGRAVSPKILEIQDEWAQESMRTDRKYNLLEYYGTDK